MKKKILAFIMAAATCFSLTACNTDPAGAGNSNASNPDAGNSNAGDSTPAGDGSAIDLVVWGPEEDQTFLTGLIEDFKKQYPDQTFNIQLGVESEATAKDTVLTDPSAAADVYAFASDQLNALVAASALANLTDLSDAFKAITGSSIDDIMAQNIDGAVAAATKDGKYYALPLGAGNNFFMFYDKSKITADDVKTWSSLLEAASAAGKKAGMVFSSGWYNGGFFLGAGFTASMNDDGTTNIDWNKTSADGISGVDVVEGMITIASNPAFMAIADNDISNQIASGELCAVVTGSWDMLTCETAWGAENVGVAKLPTYSCAGKEVQQGCYSGFKLMGVNGMSKQVGWAAVLAEFLTNESAQMKRYDARQLAPTNIKASESDAVKANEMLAASIAQDAACGVLQDVGDKYWDPTATLGELIAQGQLKSGDTAAIQAALDTMVEGVTAPVE
ncbi:MAG: extracellular solute-binding protein [Ruminococcaceae bacterium]|nr:extracellular solute-binding protein [Oscillospiraceae bacterium]